MAKTRRPKAEKIAEGATQTVVDTSPIVRANLARDVVKTPNFVSLYANDIQIQITPWDVRLLLGEIAGLPTLEHPTVGVNQIGELRMSPQLAKKLTVLLFGQLKTYEEKIGPIPQPPD